MSGRSTNFYANLSSSKVLGVDSAYCQPKNLENGVLGHIHSTYEYNINYNFTYTLVTTMSRIYPPFPWEVPHIHFSQEIYCMEILMAYHV